MAVDLTLPDWLFERMEQWKHRLHMWEWRVNLRLEMVLNSDDSCRGLAEQWPDINFGKIAIRADVEDTPEWEEVLVHELLHIKHSRIDHAVEGVLIPNAGAPEVVVQSVYRQAVEPFIDAMAKVLVQMHRAGQAVEEQKLEDTWTGG